MGVARGWASRRAFGLLRDRPQGRETRRRRELRSKRDGGASYDQNATALRATTETRRRRELRSKRDGGASYDRNATVAIYARPLSFQAFHDVSRLAGGGIMCRLEGQKAGVHPATSPPSLGPCQPALTATRLPHSIPQLLGAGRWRKRPGHVSFCRVFLAPMANSRGGALSPSGRRR